MQTTIQDVPLDQLRDRHDRAHLAVETLQLESQLALIAPETTRVTMEAWGDLVDPREHLYDVPSWGTQRGTPYAQLDDRLDGRYRPIFETEQDLAYIRGSGRTLAEYFSGGINIQETLANYTIGKGCEYKAEPAEDQEPPQGLVGAVQKVLNTLLDINQWPADGEREFHNRTREDGEGLVRLCPDGWKTRLLFLEVDQLRDPQGFGRDLENWLGCGEQFVSSWSFGVHTRKDRPGEPLGYHIVNDNAGFDYEYVRAKYMEHLKRNVPRNVKRGVSDYYPVVQWLNHAEKVLRNTASGAAVQAAIAFIRQHAAGVTKDQASGMIGGNAYDRRTQSTPLGGRVKNAQRYDAGTIIDVNFGQEYKPGPMGSERAPQFINVIQAALRYCGIRWSMHEGIVSGDWSNANMASMTVAESPFVKAREADQRLYKGAFHSIAWKAVRIAWEAGFFDRFGVSWEQLEALVDIEVTPPTVATRDPKERAATDESEIRAGTKSRETAIAEAGRDPKVELERMQREGWKPQGAQPGMGGFPGAELPHLPGQPAPEPTGEFGDKSRLQWSRNVKAIRDVLGDLISGTNTPAMAKELLLSLGLSGQRAERLIADAQDNQQIDDPELQESILEVAKELAAGQLLLESSHDRLSRAAAILFEEYP